MLLILVILGALVLWGLRGGGSGPAASSADDSAGGGPAPSITPGATDTESHIDERPGGSERTDDAEGDADDPDGADPDDPDGAGGAGDSSTDDGGNGGDSDRDGGDGADSGGWDDVAGGSEAGSGLPDCVPGEQLSIALSSNENNYSPDEQPTLRLALTNASTTACAADIGNDALTVLLSTDNDEVWNSTHCPAHAASYRLAVPAQSTVGYTVDWDRRYSDREQCEGPKPPSAPYGTYLAEAAMAGFDTVQTTFRLDED